MITLDNHVENVSWQPQFNSIFGFIKDDDGAYARITLSPYSFSSLDYMHENSRYCDNYFSSLGYYFDVLLNDRLWILNHIYRAPLPEYTTVDGKHYRRLFVFRTEDDMYVSIKITTRDNMHNLLSLFKEGLNLKDTRFLRHMLDYSARREEL